MSSTYLKTFGTVKISRTQTTSTKVIRVWGYETSTIAVQSFLQFSIEVELIAEISKTNINEETAQKPESIIRQSDYFNEDLYPG